MSSISKVEQSGKATNIHIHEQTKEIVMTRNSHTDPEAHKVQQQISTRSQYRGEKGSMEEQGNNKLA